MKSRSPSRGNRPCAPARRARQQGFTLLEILIASAIGLAVVAIATEAYFAANKAKAQAVGGSLLKTAGQQAVDEIYKGLHQSKHLFVRGDLADSFLVRLPIKPFDAQPDALSPGPEAAELRLPDLKLTGAFFATTSGGSPNPNFDPDSAGNALFFARSEQNVQIQDAGSSTLQTVFGAPTLGVPVYTLQFYYLCHRPLPPGVTVRQADPYVYGLMHFRSKPYLDYHEVVDMVRTIKRSGIAGADGAIDDELRALAARGAGAIALDAPDGAHAFYDLRATVDHQDLVEDDAALVAADAFRTPLAVLMRPDFGEAMVAFNTTAPSGKPAFPAAGLQVPAFAPPDAAYPFGLETLVAGPPDARQVLVRLALAARTMPGRVMIGETFQQVVQVYDF